MPYLQLSNVPHQQLDVPLRRLPGACPVFRHPAYRSFITVPGQVRGATYQASNERMVSMPGPTKSNPPPVEPTGASNKVDDERRPLKPGGPSRTLAAS